MLVELILLSIAISVVAFTYSEILTDSEMVLYHWRGFLYRIFKSEDHFLFKILVGCSYCVGGQWALWTYLYLCIFDNQYFDMLVYNPFVHIGFVSVTVFNVAIIKKCRIYEREE